MAEMNQFRVVAWWASGRTGIAKSDSAPNAIHFTSAPAFGGVEGRWTPEDLLLSALASCYTITFRTLAEYSKLEYTDLQVEVGGVIGKAAERGYNFVELSICVDLTIPEEAERERATKLMHKAKDVCLISRALAIKQRFKPVARVAAPQLREAPKSLV